MLSIARGDRTASDVRTTGRCASAEFELSSVRSLGDCFDNSVAESFFGTVQLVVRRAPLEEP